MNHFIQFAKIAKAELLLLPLGRIITTFHVKGNKFSSLKEVAFLFFLSAIFCYSSEAQISAEALDFDGVDDYVGIPHSTSLNLGTGDFTVEAWIKTRSSASLSRVVTKIPDGGNGFDLDVSSGKAGIFIRDQSQLLPNFVFPQSTTMINDNNWHHIAGVREGDIARIYVDGIEGQSATGADNLNINNGQTLDIGRWYQEDFPLDGQIDEVRLWNRALCQAEIQAQMNCSFPDQKVDY